MTLEDQIKQTMSNLENTSSETILEIITQIMPNFRSELTSDYLQGKIQKIRNENDESEQKKQCLTLIPYFEWYLQGL
jgi:hypothetical protein